MKLAIMQPYFFPYLGYFDLINKVDRWIVFDTPQYIRHGWVNRNRILHPTAGWLYIIVPVNKYSRGTSISQIESSSTQDWRNKILGQLEHYRKRAPFFDETVQLVKQCLAVDEPSLSRLNAFVLDQVCEQLEIPFQFDFSSEMSLELGPINGPGDWALQISRALNASTYINPPGGAHLFDRAEFEKYGIELAIQDYSSFTYPTGSYEFIPDLSIIDVMMWNSAAAIKAFLDEAKSKEA